MSEKMFKLALESVAITIHDHIKDLQADSSMQSYRRWIWELIQNAIDLCDEDKACAIKCQLSKDQVNFMHNGTPFEEYSLNHLFFKKTSKKDKVEGKPTIGNFGTGFLTTHLLSKRIEISGVYRQEAGTYSRFENFVLDREGDFHQITDNLFKYSAQLKELENSSQTIEFQQHSEENTKFRYPIESELPLKAVEYGVQDLQLCLPYSIVFISHLKKLQSIGIRVERIPMVQQMSDELAQEQITTDDSMSFGFNYKVENWFGLNVYRIQRSLGDQNNTFVFELHHDSISLCLPIDVKERKRPRMRIEARHANLANLFLVFPLIGTEKVNFPFIINSYDFKPTKERNGIILFGPDSERVNHNRRLMVQSLELSKKFIRLISESIQSKSGKWKNLHLLAEIQTPANKQEYIDIEWYTKTIIRDYKAFLFDEPLVLTDNGFLPLKKCRIPYHIDLENSISFAGLCKQLFKTDIPSDKILKEWIQAYMIEEQHWPQSVKMTIDDLTRDLSDFGFKHFLMSYKKKIDLGYKHLNALIKTIEMDSPDLLKKYPILPNQEQEFQLAKPMYIDQNIPEVYKDMHDILNQSSIRKILLDPRVNTARIHLEKSNESISQELLLIYNKAEQDPKLLLEASFKLLNYRKPQLELSNIQKQFLQLISPVYPITEYTKEGSPYVSNEGLVKYGISTISKEIIEKIKNELQVQNLNFFSQIHSLEDKTTWLFQFIQFLTDNSMDQLFTDQKVVPNKQGKLIPFKEAIRDENIEPRLLDLYDGLVNYARKNLSLQTEVNFSEITPRLIDRKLKHLELRTLNSEGVLDMIMKVIEFINTRLVGLVSEKEIHRFRAIVSDVDYRQNLIAILQKLLIYSKMEQNIKELIHVNEEKKQKEYSWNNQQMFLRSLDEMMTLVSIKKIPKFQIFAKNQLQNIPQLTLIQVEYILDLIAYYFIEQFCQLDQKHISVELPNIVRLLKYISRTSENKSPLNFSQLIELCPIIPNQKMQLKKPGELHRDWDDIYARQGTPDKLKMIYDQLSLKQIELQNYNRQNYKSILEILAPPSVECKFINTCRDISSTLQTIDDLFNDVKNKIEKSTVIDIFRYLDNLVENNPKYKETLRKFQRLKPTLYMDLFASESDRNKVLDLVSGNQLNNAYFLKKAMLDKHFRPNAILYQAYHSPLLNFYKHVGVIVNDTIHSQETVVLQGEIGLPVRVMIFFAINPSIIMLKPEEIAFILSPKEFVDLQIIDVSKPLTTENIGEHSYFVTKFDQILLTTPQNEIQQELSLEKKHQNWDSFVKKLKVKQVEPKQELVQTQIEQQVIADP